MAYNYEYPYTDASRVNSDWIIKRIMELSKEFEEFVIKNEIKYADPIQWSISTQYEKYTIVTNENVAYLSKKEVPTDISLFNSEYWLKIADFGTLYEQIKHSIAGADDYSSTTTTADRTEGELVWLSDVLYKVVRDMNVGDAYISEGVNPNVVTVTVEELLNELREDITGIIEELQEMIDGLSDALNDEIENRTNADSELEELIEKSKLYYNVLDYNIVNDGVTDNTTALQELCSLVEEENRPIYFPSGVYKWNDSVTTVENTKFIFEDATIVGDTNGHFEVDDNNSFTGRLNYKGSSCFIIIANKNNTIVDLDCIIDGCTTNGYAFVTAEYGNNITVKGHYTTNKGKLIITNDSNFVDVSGLNGVYEYDTDIPPITITGSHTDGSYHDIAVHDCYVDGGGVLSNGIISITRNEEVTGWSDMFVPDYNISVYNFTSINSTGVTDGIDVLFANHVTIHDCVVKGCFEGIAIVSSYVEINNCFVTGCRSCGIAIGDVGLTTTDTAQYTGILITNCMLTDNGTGSGDYVIPAGITTRQYNSSSSVTNLFVNNCVIYGQAYALDFVQSVTSNVCVTDSFTIGTTGPVNLTDESGLYFKNVRGYSPIGFRTPSVLLPTATNPCPNNFASDCEVSIINSANTTLYMKRFTDEPVAFAVLKAGYPYTFTLPKDCSFYVGDATDLTFTMFGL